MSGLAAGELNRKITLLRRGVGRDSLKQPVVGDWTDYADTWANIKTPTGMATIKGYVEGTQAPLNRYSFRVRFREDITTADAIRFGGDIYNIIDIRQDYAGRIWTDFICEVGAIDG